MTTTLLIIRHAKAAEGDYPDDTLRPLHEEGKQVHRQMMEQLKQQGYAPNKILCSPYLRARQAAEIAAEILGGTVEENNALGAEFDAEEILKQIPPPDTDQTLMLVGHEPTLSQLANALVGKICLPLGLSKSGTVVITFSKEIAFGQGSFETYSKP